MFSGCTVPPDSKKTELGSSDQEASPSEVKNTGIGLAVYVKEGLPFTQDLPLEDSADSYVCFHFTQCLTSFPSINHFLCLCAWFLILFHVT